ncbi:MAG: LLM class flavin-dependent oxidoreductase [Chloroflexia bacterium]
MQIGIGLPNTVTGTPGRTLIEWAQRAEERGFSTLTTIGRVAFPGYEELIALTAAAAVTQRIGLLTDVLLVPTRDPVMLAKEAASLDQLSGGRFVLGVGVGGREDDFVAVGRDIHDRGKRMDAALELMHRAWQGEPVAGSPVPVGPMPVNPGGVPLMIGGNTDAAIERVVR